ncbi:MAG: hypothetical protein KKF41_10575 [Actinobacteria bacterium]|nr:hypothetical protein [Actinomycetota bacterium]MBU1944725.1 hypothetical protein [Actinomycetota bacterium]MBU2688017.1 hypothetical protein [Actinomycetota bacterium]
MIVGVPRALLYHQYGGSWTAFLDSLGVETLLTQATSGETVLAGTERADNETCLPMKVFAGHLIQLKDSCDAVLVPRVVSQYHRTKSCPKYLGLPDVARALEPDLPPVLDPRMDLADRRARWTSDWNALALEWGASRGGAALAVHRMKEALREIEPLPSRPVEGGLRVGIAGHLYNMFDSRASLGLLDKVRDTGAGVLTIEQVSRHQVRRQLRTLQRKIYWDFEGRIVGGVLHWNRTACVDGIIYVSSFACGPGSMIGALLEDQLGREDSVPFMNITLDEHSAEGGLITRVEAFMDMLKRVGVERPRTRGGGGVAR